MLGKDSALVECYNFRSLAGETTKTPVSIDDLLVSPSEDTETVPSPGYLGGGTSSAGNSTGAMPCDGSSCGLLSAAISTLEEIPVISAAATCLASISITLGALESVDDVMSFGSAVEFARWRARFRLARQSRILRTIRMMTRMPKMAPIAMASIFGRDEESSLFDGAVLVAMAVSVPVMVPVTVCAEAASSDWKVATVAVAVMDP